jgi:hypothetical protein
VVGKQKRHTGKQKRWKRPSKNVVGWGRGASQYRPGEFIHIYLSEHDEACCADIFYALKQDLKRINQERVEIGEKPIKGCTYNSFTRYWHWYKKLRLIEPSGRTEPAIYDFLESRVFYRLSGSGDDTAWSDPLKAAHPELR